MRALWVLAFISGWADSVELGMMSDVLPQQLSCSDMAVAERTGSGTIARNSIRIVPRCSEPLQCHRFAV